MGNSCLGILAPIRVFRNTRKSSRKKRNKFAGKLNTKPLEKLVLTKTV